MTAKDLRKSFLDFFIEKGHKQIPSASLIPENDPTTLFISAGMHPLVPYLLGEVHPLGKRLCSVQKCIRTGDIEEVGDSFHQTFFEMLGNWSLSDSASPDGSQGGYWKEEMIPWSFEFLTKVLNIPLEKLSVTCFAGDNDAPRDEETALLWEKAGIPKERIYFLGKEDNWWGPAGKTGPCGPDSEMFFDTGKQKCGKDCRPGCSCGKYFEIWNDVFMQYEKRKTQSFGKLRINKQNAKRDTENNGDEYEFVPLKQRNIDTGMGIERTITVLSGLNDSYRNELFLPIIKKIEEISGKNYEEEKYQKPMRVIADHIKASVFIINEEITPSNTEQGYVLRRLIRRSIRFGKMLGVEKPFTDKVALSVIEIMGDIYPEIIAGKDRILTELSAEEKRFLETLQRGIKEFEKISLEKEVSGNDAFFLYETYGFPLELTKEMAAEKGMAVNETEFLEAQEEHQKLSRAGGEKKFSGGLSDHSEISTKYHTATHLLHQALRAVLGEEVHQSGSNITAERLRFDFTYPEKMTAEQIKEVENLVNEQIEKDLPVTMEVMSLEEAKKAGALAFFEQKYAEQVKVYSMGSFSKEVCGGPHVEKTGVLGIFQIFKEESSGAGKRRIYAKLS